MANSERSIFQEDETLLAAMAVDLERVSGPHADAHALLQVVIIALLLKSQNVILNLFPSVSSKKTYSAVVRK